MSDLRSSVLIIGHPNPDQVLFGADFCDDFKDITEPSELKSFNVVTFTASSKNQEQVYRFLEYINENRPGTQKIVILEDNNIELMQSLIESNNLLFLSIEKDAKIIAMGIFLYNSTQIHFISGTTNSVGNKLGANNSMH